MVYKIRLRRRIISPEEINAYQWTKGEWQKIIPDSQPKEVVDVYREKVISRARAVRERRKRGGILGEAGEIRAEAEPSAVAEKLVTTEAPVAVISKYKQVKAYIVWGSSGHSEKNIKFDDTREVDVFFWVKDESDINQDEVNALMDKAVSHFVGGHTFKDVQGWHNAEWDVTDDVGSWADAYTSHSITGRYEDKDSSVLKYAECKYFCNNRQIGRKYEIYRWGF